ncbi:MAG TPA: pitrilysin family protein [Myxococcales bacterium]|nr:pitrilysin family protein [Myxococcales bacterium]
MKATARRIPIAVSIMATLALSAGAAAAGKIASDIHHTKIAGIQIYLDKTHVSEEIVLRGALPAGDVFNPPGKSGIARLVAGMLDKGTAHEDKLALAKKLESVGATLSFRSDAEMLNIEARFLKADVALVIALLAEELREPAFSTEELGKLKEQLKGDLARRREDTGDRADEAFRRAIYPEGHPNRPPSLDELEKAVDAATVEELRAFHGAHYGPEHLTLVFVGDIDPSALATALRQGFSGWKGENPLATGALGGWVAGQREIAVDIPGKTSVDVRFGQAVELRYKDPDALALRMGAAILGGGFTGRLMATVRDSEGLTYGIGAGINNDSFVAGDFAISATFAPALLEKGIASTRREFSRWYQDGVTDGEVVARKTDLIGTYQVSLASPSGLASAILTTLERGYDLNWLDDYPDAINALTTSQVNAAIRKYLSPDRMKLVKAGTIPAASRN